MTKRWQPSAGVVAQIREYNTIEKIYTTHQRCGNSRTVQLRQQYERGGDILR
jgi:hypothetical protein